MNVGIQSNKLIAGEDELPVGDGSADGLGDRFIRQQGALLVAARTKAALLTGEGDEHLVAAVGTTNAGKAVVQVAAAKESARHVADNRSPRTVLFGITPVVGPLELRQVTLDGPKKRRLSRLARAVNRC